MNTQHDELEALLGADAPIDDGGFTAAVLARLPAPRRRGRGLVLGAAAALGAVGLAVAAPGFAAMLALGTARAPTSTWITALLLLALVWVPVTMALEER